MIGQGGSGAQTWAPVGHRLLSNPLTPQNRMYLPAHFSEDRLPELHRIIRDYPLATLVAPGGLDADHLPFELLTDEQSQGTLIAHVARANPLWQRCPTGTEVLVIFQGAAGYISPNWYPSKHETHRQVPTWNYEVVHVRGVVSIHDDERALRRIVGRLTRRHEAAEPRPWKMSDSAPEYIAGMIQNIVGLEICITSIIGKSKLSQNREPRDRAGAAEVLAERGARALSDAMRRDR